jgi:hypothetical protein
MAHSRDRHPCSRQCVHNAVLAIDLVRTRKQLTGRLFPQHIVQRTVWSLRRQFECRVRSAALYLLNAELATEAFDLPF